ncbi:MAG TPA: hypothetical protein VGP92_07275 [Acidimicrobiia bacterium]|jgi:hypothetical protein|nr:hypothetical protein [Acidimicrobiia bacterium]
MSAVAEPTTVWRRNDTALTRLTSRSVLLTTAQSDEMHRLEGTAMFVWLELETPATDEQLVGGVAAGIGVEGDDVRGFVLAARRTLVEIGAIVESDD